MFEGAPNHYVTRALCFWQGGCGPLSDVGPLKPRRALRATPAEQLLSNTESHTLFALDRTSAIQRLMAYAREQDQRTHADPNFQCKPTPGISN